MAAQAMYIADTIAGMKKAISRNNDGSDSDESIRQATNRGNKLKRKAKYMREGQLDIPNGPRVYRRKVDHAGYKRYIINQNPPRYSGEGDLLEEDEIDEEADANAAEEDPYRDIDIEHTLAPLTAAADLPNHPSLSIPYYSKPLTEMSRYASEVTQKEKELLWKIKQLFTRFNGDSSFAPCSVFETDGENLFGHSAGKAGDINGLSQPNKLSNRKAENHSDHEKGEEKREPAKVQAMPNGTKDEVDMPNSIEHDDSSKAGEKQHAQPETMEVDGGGPEVKQERRESDGDNSQTDKSSKDDTNQESKGADAEEDAEEHAETSTVKAAGDANRAQKNEPNGVERGSKLSENETASGSAEHPTEDGEAAGSSPDDEADQPQSHRMTTRAQAQQAASTDDFDQPGSPLDDGSSFIHPLFLIAGAAFPDRDFGLPGPEAEETRRMLLHAVQKQEEVCRGHQRLHESLMRADRMRKEVLKWTKAEGHVGEMSDGEDWYDKEEWGLEEDLKKGAEEDEEETANQGKKTRRRAA